MNKRAVLVSRTLFGAREVAGSAKYKQRKTVWNCVVSLRLVCLFSHENKER